MYAALLLSFASCRTYNMLDGKSRPVYFTPDASVFSDTDFHNPAIVYSDLLNIRGNLITEVALKKGETSAAIIRQPTLFNGFDNFLVYPGEHILIKKGKYNEYTFIKINGSRRRNNELSFFKTFSQIEHYPIPPTINNASLDTILILEKEQKSKIAESEVENKRLFDSLTKAYNVSEKFKKITVDYLENRYRLSLFGLYKQYKDTLQAHGLYRGKCAELTSVFSNTSDNPTITDNFITLNEIADAVLPVKIHRVSNKDNFTSCFDFIENHFTGLQRNYLLSQLMYLMYTKRIDVSNYLAKYNTICTDKSYKELVYNVKLQQEKNDVKSIAYGTNTLITVNGKEIISLENLISKHKGKLIIFDFWATWCAPCREEMPYFKKLIQKYPEDKVVFLSISVERETQVWQKFVMADNFKINNNYLMVDQAKSLFINQYEINSIPRYIVIDQKGKIIDTDCPKPSDLKLEELINKNLK